MLGENGDFANNKPYSSGNIKKQLSIVRFQFELLFQKNGIPMFYPDKATLDSWNTIVAVIETNTCH